MRALRLSTSTPRVRPSWLAFLVAFASLAFSACDSNPMDPMAAVPVVEEQPGVDAQGAPPARVAGTVKDLSVSATDQASVTLSWTEVADDHGDPASYEIRYSAPPLDQAWDNATVAVSGSCASPLKGSKVGATLSCSVTGLDTGKDYEIQVAAFRMNNSGQAKTTPTMSNIVAATTYAAIPGTVSDLSASALSTSSATVSWTQVQDGLGAPASYELRYTLLPGDNNWGTATVVSAGSCAAPVAGTDIGAPLSCSIEGLEAGKDYEVRLVAFRDDAGARTYSAKLSNAITVTTDAVAVTAQAPGTVGDLAVTGTDAQAVHLSWTTVGDGLGGLALYEVRYAPTPIGYGWGTATVVTSGDCASPISASALGVTRSCTVDGLTSGQSYDLRLVAFRVAPDGSRIYSDALSNVVTGVTTEVTSPPPPPPSTSGTNEPAGFAKLVGTSYSAAAEGGFSSSVNENFSIVSDATAPFSPGSVAQARFAAGLGDGVSPIWSAAGIADRGVRKLYVSFWMKVSDNWQGHETGVNKVAILWTHEKPAVVANMNGVGAGRLMSEIRLQDVPDGARNLTANVGAAELTRGKWHHWEIVLISNGGDGADGVVQWWIDGNKVGDYRDVRFGTSAQSKIWDNVTWRPVWGGRGDTVKEDMYMWMDDYYASGTQ